MRRKPGGKFPPPGEKGIGAERRELRRREEDWGGEKEITVNGGEERLCRTVNL